MPKSLDLKIFLLLSILTSSSLAKSIYLDPLENTQNLRPMAVIWIHGANSLPESYKKLAT